MLCYEFLCWHFSGKLTNNRNCKFILTDVLGLHIRKRYLKQVTFLGKLRFGKKVLLYMCLKNSTVLGKLKVCVMVL